MHVLNSQSAIGAHELYRDNFGLARPNTGLHRQRTRTRKTVILLQMVGLRLGAVTPHRAFDFRLIDSYRLLKFWLLARAASASSASIDWLACFPVYLPQRLLLLLESRWRPHRKARAWSRIASVGLLLLMVSTLLM